MEEVDDYEYVVVERPGTEDQTAAGPGDPEPPSSQPRQMASFSSDSSTQSEHGKMASFPSTDTTQPPYSGQYYLPASYGELRHSESSMLTKGYPDSYPLGPYQYYPGLPPGPYYPQPYPPGSVSGMEEPVKGVPGIHDDNQYPGGHVVPLTGHWQGSEDKSARLAATSRYGILIRLSRCSICCHVDACINLHVHCSSALDMLDHLVKKV